MRFLSSAMAWLLAAAMCATVACAQDAPAQGQQPDPTRRQGPPEQGRQGRNRPNPGQFLQQAGATQEDMQTIQQYMRDRFQNIQQLRQKLMALREAAVGENASDDAAAQAVAEYRDLLETYKTDREAAEAELVAQLDLDAKPRLEAILLQIGILDNGGVPMQMGRGDRGQRGPGQRPGQGPAQGQGPGAGAQPGQATRGRPGFRPAAPEQPAQGEADQQ